MPIHMHAVSSLPASLNVCSVPVLHAQQPFTYYTGVAAPISLLSRSAAVESIAALIDVQKCGQKPRGQTSSPLPDHSKCFSYMQTRNAPVSAFGSSTASTALHSCMQGRLTVFCPGIERWRSGNCAVVSGPLCLLMYQQQQQQIGLSRYVCCAQANKQGRRATIPMPASLRNNL